MCFDDTLFSYLNKFFWEIDKQQRWHMFRLFGLCEKKLNSWKLAYLQKTCLHSTNIILEVTFPEDFSAAFLKKKQNKQKKKPRMIVQEQAHSGKK